MFSALSASHPSTRRWTALTSFALQTTLVAAALVLPMLWPQDLPQVFLARRIFVPLSQGEVRANVNPGTRGSVGPGRAQPLVVSRHGISFSDHIGGPVADPEAPALGFEDAGSRSLGIVADSGPAPMPVKPKPTAARTSVIMEGNLIHRVEPQYPAMARQIHMEGAVVLKAIISREGNIEQLEVTSGRGLLALAAKEAVRQWKYRPYFLNGQPVEVETQITVNFVLGQ